MFRYAKLLRIHTSTNTILRQPTCVLGGSDSDSFTTTACIAAPSDGGARRNGTPGPSMVDTSGSCTCIDQDAANRAGLGVIDQGSISSASHFALRVPVFAREIEVAGFGMIRLPRAMGVSLANPRLIAAIRRDVLRSTVSVHTGLTGDFSIARKLGISSRWDLN